MASVSIPFPDPAIFAHEIPVRITDLNYGNHLAHDILVSMLHEARARFFRAHEMEEGNVDGPGVILVDLAVRYRAQVFYGQTLRIEIAVGNLGSRGCDFFYRVSDHETGAAVAEAKTGIVFFDYATNKVAGVPPRFREIVGGGSES